MTGLIDRMERAKLVNRRVWRIELTDRGKRLQPRISAVFEEAYLTLTEGILLGELAVAKKVLVKFIENSGYLKGSAK